MENTTPQQSEGAVPAFSSASTPVTTAPAVVAPIMDATTTGMPPSPPSSMKKIIIAAVALLVVGGVGAYAYLNSAATPAAPKTIAQKANPNEPPPTLEVADDNGLKGSFVDTTQGTLQFDNTDITNFASKQASLQAIYGNPATLVAGTNYLFANNDMTMADVYAAINPAANRILLATYNLGENGNATGFYTYPKGPFKGTFDIEHDTVNPQSGSLAKVLVKKNRAIVILAEKPSTVYGLHNSVEEPINALTSALLPADNVNGWTLVALKSGKLTDVIAPFKDRVASLWLLNSQNAFDQKADISATSTTTITNSHIAWVNLNTKAAITSGFSDSNPDPCIASNTCSTAPTLTLATPTPTITQGQELVVNLTGKNLIGATVAGPDSASTGLSILANSYKVTDTSISFIVVASATATPAPATAPANFKITAGTPATLFTQPIIVAAKAATDAGFTVFPIAPQTITQGTSLAVSLDGVNLTDATVAVTPAVTGLTISTPVATATNLSFTITTTAATPAGAATLTITAGGKTFTLPVNIIAAPTLTALATAPVVTQGQEISVNLVGTNLATATITAPATTTKLYISEASKKITATSISFTLSAGIDAPTTTPADIVITVGTTVFKQSVSVKAMVAATDPSITSLPLAVVDVIQGTPKVITITGTNLTGAKLSYPTTATGLTITEGVVGTAAKPGTELKFTVNTTTATPVGLTNVFIKIGADATAVTFTQPIMVKTVADTTAPTVTAVTPAPVAPATTVATTAPITATFSEAMDVTTITTTTFTLTSGTTAPVAVAGTPTLDTTKLVATFAPTSPLAVNTTYTATITTGAKDLAGNALAAAKTWTFTTAAVVPAGTLPAPTALVLNPATTTPDMTKKFSLAWTAPVSPVATDKVSYIWKIVSGAAADSAAFEAPAANVIWGLTKGYSATGVNGQDATCYVGNKWSCTTADIDQQAIRDKMAKTPGTYTWGVQAYTSGATPLTSPWALSSFTTVAAAPAETDTFAVPLKTCVVSATETCVAAALTSITPQTDLTLATLKSTGLAFTGVNTNTSSYYLMGGKYFLSYNWSLHNDTKNKDISAMASGWNNPPLTGTPAVLAACAQFNKWLCPSGTFSNTLFATGVDAGDTLTLTGIVYDGKTSSPWKTVTFKVAGAAAPAATITLKPAGAAPTKPVFTSPLQGKSFTLTELQANGLSIAATDTNNTSFSKDKDGTYYMQYSLLLKSEVVTGWPVFWSSGTGFAADATKINDTCITPLTAPTAVSAITCPKGTIPASVFNDPKFVPGVYGISLTVSDGQSTTTESFVEFTITGAAPADTTKPTVISSIPTYGTPVTVNPTISASFSEAMNASTINNTTVILAKNSAPSIPIPVTVTPGTSNVTIVPTSALENSIAYLVKITTGVKDLAGNALAADYFWSFLTTDPYVAPSSKTDEECQAEGYQYADGDECY